MKAIQLLLLGASWLASIAAASAEFVLNLNAVSPTAAELQFHREPGYYYCLENSTDLDAGFAPVSGWLSGDDSTAVWPLSIDIDPPPPGEPSQVPGDTFNLYPFADGRTLVSWFDALGVCRSALVSQDYSTLPPIFILHGSETAGDLLLLFGRLNSDTAYDALNPALLPLEQQTVLQRLTNRYTEIMDAASASPTGQGLVADGEKQFYRIRRMSADADEDGLDWAAEVFVHGTNPDEWDSDGDGMDDAAEVGAGLNANNPDTDNDSVPDSTDRYANDSLRSDDVPWSFYGAIDLNRYLATPFVMGYSLPIEGGGGPLITVSDQNHVAWAGEVLTGEVDPANEPIRALRIITWVNGQVTKDVSVPLTTVDEFATPPGGGTPRPHIRRYSLSPVGISVGTDPNGTDTRVAGNATARDFWKDPGSANYRPDSVTHGGTFECMGDGTFVPGVSRQGPFSQYHRLSREGHLFWIRRWHVDNGGAGEDHKQVMIDGQVLPYAESEVDSVFSLAISDDGHTVVQLNQTRQLCSPDGTVEGLPLSGNDVWVTGVNDEKWIVGTNGYEDPNANFPDPTEADPNRTRKGRGYLGFVFENGVLHSFHDELPDRYQKQLRSAIPTMIQNPAQPGDAPRIAFSADSWEGNPAAWTSHSFNFEWDPYEGARIWRGRLPVVYDPQAGKVRELSAQFSQWNNQAALSGMVENAQFVQATAQGSGQAAAPGGSQFIAALFFENKFKPTGQFNEGFDPPIPGDIDPATGINDDDDPVPWTSVSKSGPLNLNQRTKVVFTSAAMASHFEVCAAGLDEVPFANDTVGLISVTPKGRLSAAETPLYILGNPGDDTIQNALILIRTADPTHQVMWKMKVMVLPDTAPLNAKFYHMGGLPDQNVPGIATPAEIKAEIDELFAPAGITLQTTDTQYSVSTRETAVGGDCNFLLAGILYNRERTMLRGLQPPGTTQILLNDFHFAQLASEPNYGVQNAEGAKEVMERTAAHEFGHFLTLATRQWPIQGGHDIWGPTNGNPDLGWPQKARALMRNAEIAGRDGAPGRWMRHEDWRAANDEARRLKP